MHAHSTSNIPDLRSFQTGSLNQRVVDSRIVAIGSVQFTNELFSVMCEPIQQAHWKKIAFVAISSVQNNEQYVFMECTGVKKYNIILWNEEVKVSQNKNAINYIDP